MNTQTMMYKGLEWYIINETEKEKLLFLKECFTNKMIQKYFKKYDENFDVQFNSDKRKIWWEDSYIREILNGPFLNLLDINDLNIMETTLRLEYISSKTRDYVRLITKEEVIKLRELSVEILKTKRKYGYWTMNTHLSDNGHPRIWRVNGAVSGYPGYLNGDDINGTSAIRPIISLKQDYDKSKIITSGYTPEQLENIKRLQKLRNI